MPVYIHKSEIYFCGNVVLLFSVDTTFMHVSVLWCCKVLGAIFVALSCQTTVPLEHEARRQGYDCHFGFFLLIMTLFIQCILDHLNF